MIGICSNSLNNSYSDLIDIQEYFDFYECSKYFYISNFRKIDTVKLPCNCFSSLVAGNYNLNDKNERGLFVKEFVDSCKMSLDLNCHKLMFGLLRFRRQVNQDIYKLFEELCYIAYNYHQVLLYEALSPKVGNTFIKNHSELIEFSKQHNIPSIHVDYKTLVLEKEKISELNYPISNIHYPIGIPITLDNVALENYNNLPNNEIKEWLRSL